MEGQFKEKMPFVAYSKPNSREVKALLQSDDTLYYISDFVESGFAFAPFDDGERPILIPLNKSDQLSCNSDFISTEPSNKKSHNLDKTPASERTKHINLVLKGIEAILSAKLKKVVLSRCEATELTEDNPITIFKRLLENYPTAFVYCWFHPKVGLWLGATPETLIEVRGNQFKTMALAGTQVYDGSLDVVWPDKEKQEQQFVTDYIFDSLKSSVSSLKVLEIETVKAGNLLHLRTQITGTLNFEFLDFKQVLNALHPTPATCGLPRNSAKQFILEHERYDREFYTGFLGELNYEGKSELFVNLRCMKLLQNQAIIYVGGGITKDSNPNKEWIETVNKTKTMKKVLM